MPLIPLSKDSLLCLGLVWPKLKHGVFASHQNGISVGLTGIPPNPVESVAVKNFSS